jgi:uncharacterized membrane protein YjjP (DUF1212 family)
LSAFLFALYSGNVFQFGPAFLLGIAVGILTMRTGSIWPAVVFRVVLDAALLLLSGLAASAGGWLLFNPATAAAGALIAAVLLILTTYRHLTPLWRSSEET